MCRKSVVTCYWFQIIYKTSNGSQYSLKPDTCEILSTFEILSMEQLLNLYIPLTGKYDLIKQNVSEVGIATCYWFQIIYKMSNMSQYILKPGTCEPLQY